jgi:nucleoid-associated protein YgaU
MPRNPNQMTQGPGTSGGSSLPAQPSAVAPPISVPGPANPPPGAATLGVPPATNPGAAALGVPPVGANDSRVISFDEETYICKPNDTLASICRDRYHSDQYAQALLLFNRSHPMSAPGIRSEPPVLQAGQPVYIPPLEILQKRYPAGSIPNAPSPSPGGSQGGLLPGPAPSNPPVAFNQLNPAGTAPAAPVSRGRDWLYTVQTRPETFYDIAKRELGNGDRWSDIYRLNPAFAPGEPLQVGTTLRMPPQ